MGLAGQGLEMVERGVCVIVGVMTGLEVGGQGMTFGELVVSSQEAWKEAERGWLSRPVVMERLSRAVAERVFKTFEGYIDPSRPPVLLAWSVLVDKPDRENLLLRRKMVPEEASDKAQEYILGMTALTEWVTNYAAKYFMRQQLNNWIWQEIVGGVGEVVDIFTGRITFKYAYELMGELRRGSRQLGIDFDEAVFSGYFGHDLASLNRLVGDCWGEDSRLPVRNVNDLAVHIGEVMNAKGNVSLHKTLTQLFRGKSKDLPGVEQLKRIAESYVFGGVHGVVGVAEVGVLAEVVALGVAIEMGVRNGFVTDRVEELWWRGGGVAMLLSILPIYGLIHEAMHGYSEGLGDEEGILFNGLSPTVVVGPGRKGE